MHVTQHHKGCLKKCAAKCLDKKDVYAVGLGEKITNGQSTGEIAIVVSVKKKLPIRLIAQWDEIPEKVDDISTDVIEIHERPKARQDYASKQRPITPGISVGHFNVTAGTLGALVKVGGTTRMLSNNHIFADSNKAGLGDSIWQPARYDGGGPNFRIGELTSYELLQFYNDAYFEPPLGEVDSTCWVAGVVADSLNWVAAVVGSETRLRSVIHSSVRMQVVQSHIILNRVDAAVASIDKDISWQNTYLDYIAPVKGVNVDAGTCLKVQKLGRTTGHTIGWIQQTNVMLDVEYDPGILARFDDQIAIGKGDFSDGGDSGSLVMDMKRRAVGLLFAGGPTLTFANPIEDVMELLKIDGFV